MMDGYPGQNATVAELARLAASYHRAANRLLDMGRKGDPISRAPCRLVATQAIELYLSVFLRRSGVEAQQVRGLHHSLSDRVALAKQFGLVLRKRTEDHLSKMSSGREYLVARYAPELAASLSQINRLMATLEEVASKVDKLSPRLVAPD